MADEMLGILGMPVTKELADWCSCKQSNVSMLTNSAKVGKYQLKVVFPGSVALPSQLPHTNLTGTGDYGRKRDVC